MTPEEASAVLVVVREDEFELSATERAFCEEYFSGEHADNATRAYMVAYPNANVSTAGSKGPELLKQRRIEKYLARLRNEAIGESAQKLVPWVNLESRAQAVI